MKIGIYSNGSRDIDFKTAIEISEYLKNKKSDKPINIVRLFEYNSEELEEISKDLDYVIIIGGDGTILNFVHKVTNRSMKILGINCGNLGYLTDVDGDNYRSAIDKLLVGNYLVEERIMITCKINDKSRLALNDVYINKDNKLSMIEVNVEVNCDQLERFRGDGLIISTPTGSTAYNLSAGGAILKPTGNMLAITPVCSHMLYSRPVIVDGNDVIKLSVNLKHNQKAFVNVDGEFFTEINEYETLKVEKAEQKVYLIKTESKNFYNVLKDKMLK